MRSLVGDRPLQAALLRVLMLILIGIGGAGCAALPDARQLKQLVGLERAFAHNDVPPSPTLQGFVARQGLGLTRRITFRDPRTQQQRVVEDPAVIAEAVMMLRRGSGPADRPSSRLSETLQIELVAGPPDHVVTAVFTPASDTLMLFNVPTPAWPDHMVGTYPVDPGLGSALLATLTGAAGS